MLQLFGLLHSLGMKKLTLQNAAPAFWWVSPAVAMCAAPGHGISADQNLGLSFKKLIIITKSEKAAFSYMSLELNSSNFILYFSYMNLELNSSNSKL